MCLVLVLARPDGPDLLGVVGGVVWALCGLEFDEGLLCLSFSGVFEDGLFDLAETFPLLSEEVTLSCSHFSFCDCLYSCILKVTEEILMKERKGGTQRCVPAQPLRPTNLQQQHIHSCSSLMS